MAAMSEFVNHFILKLRCKYNYKLTAKQHLNLKFERNSCFINTNFSFPEKIIAKIK